MTNYSYALTRLAAMIAAVGALGAVGWLAWASDADWLIRAFAVGFVGSLAAWALLACGKAVWRVDADERGLRVRWLLRSRRVEWQGVRLVQVVHEKTYLTQGITWLCHRMLEFRLASGRPFRVRVNWQDIERLEGMAEFRERFDDSTTL